MKKSSLKPEHFLPTTKKAALSQSIDHVNKVVQWIFANPNLSAYEKLRLHSLLLADYQQLNPPELSPSPNVNYVEPIRQNGQEVIDTEQWQSQLNNFQGSPMHWRTSVQNAQEIMKQIQTPKSEDWESPHSFDDFSSTSTTSKLTPKPLPTRSSRDEATTAVRAGRWTNARSGYGRKMRVRFL